MPLVAPPPIETSRLTIRLVSEGDLEDLLVVNGDDLVTTYLPYASWRSLSDAQAWLQRVMTLQTTGQAVQCVLWHKTAQRVIGSCLLFRHDEGSARAELGYVLGRAHWGQGLMSEALRAFIDCAFNHLSLRRLEAEIDPRNQPSTRLVRRLGFTREGLLRQRWVTLNEPRDVEIFGLLRSEWPPRGVR